MFGSNGQLQQQKAVYYLRNQKVHDQVFNGYYYANQYGRIPINEVGLTYLSNLTCNGRTFDGYYYVAAYGKLNNNMVQARYLNAKTVNGTRFKAGYYCFNVYGALYIKPAFHTLSYQRVNGMAFKGTYYFGNTNGMLYSAKGWITVNQKKYYLTPYGKRLENCWFAGYYLQADGTIAKSTRVPDGTYVDCDGKKSTAEEYKLSALKQTLNSMIGKYSGTWCVYVKDLKTGDTLCINDKSVYPASTIKAFVMASTFDQINKGKLSYSSVKNLLTQMITVSDNEAYNQLVRMNSSSRTFSAGASVVNTYLRNNGYTKTACHHTLHPSSSSYASDGGGKNIISVKDAGVLLERIYKGTCVNSTYSQEMLNLLLGQTRTWKIPAGLPSGTKVANKTGETDSTQNDMAIVYGKKTNYVICIFSTNVSEYSGITGIRNISSTVYNYLNQ
jgi:beta-lactamase class A